MRKRWLLLILLGMLFSLIFITACHEEMHVHNYNTDWEKDATSHWYRCFDCEEITNSEPHVGGESTCIEKDTCETCGQTYGDAGSHVYGVQKYDETQHWNECVCGLVDETSVTQHAGGTATCEALAKCETCDTEYGELATHTYTVDGGDMEYHWKECSCGEILQESKTLHRDEDAGCLDACVCEDCGVTYKEKGEHSYTEIQYNATCHWWKCAFCVSETKERDIHYGGVADCDERAVCEVCKQPYGGFGFHNYVYLGYDEIHHWKECACNTIEEGTKTLHGGGEATCKERARCETCGVSYGETLAHTYDVEKDDEAYTWKECVCGEIEEGSKMPIKPSETPGDGGSGDDVDNGSNDGTGDGAGDGTGDGAGDGTGDNPPENPSDNPSDNPPNNPPDETFVAPTGEGTEDNPYVLTAGVSYKWSVSSYSDVVYFVYETTSAENVAFIDLENVDDTSFKFGTDMYFMEGIDPAYIELSAWDTYYFICQANTAGEMRFTFVTE